MRLRARCVYGGEIDPTPLMEMFDRSVQLP